MDWAVFVGVLQIFVVSFTAASVQSHLAVCALPRKRWCPIKVYRLVEKQPEDCQYE